MKASVNRWKSDFSPTPWIWNEVCAKQSRRGDVHVKLVFTEVGPSERKQLDQELSLFVTFLLERHPNILGIVYQHSPSRAKPTKRDDYNLAFGLNA